MGDHDSLFKRAFEVPAHAAGEIMSVLPETVTKQLDLSALELVPTSFVDAELAHRHADLLFTAPLRDTRALIYFLVEHQSEPDPLMPWRILEYQQRIWASVLRAEPERCSLPPIITIVVHHGLSGWTAPRRFHEIIDGLDGLPEVRALVPDFELLIDDLARVDDASLMARPLASFPKVALWVMRDARSVDAFVEHLREWVGELRKVRSRKDVDVIVRYIFRVAGSRPSDILRQRVIQIAPAWEQAMATFEEQIIEKGIEKGLERGHERARKILVRWLTSRFGPIAPELSERIARASGDELDAWADRAETAERVEDVFIS